MTAYRLGLSLQFPPYGKTFGDVIIGIPENEFLQLKTKFSDESFKGENKKMDQTIKEGITNDEKEQIAKHLGLGNTEFEFQVIVHHIDEVKEQPQFESNGKTFSLSSHGSQNGLRDAEMKRVCGRSSAKLV